MLHKFFRTELTNQLLTHELINERLEFFKSQIKLDWSVNKMSVNQELVKQVYTKVQLFIMFWDYCNVNNNKISMSEFETHIKTTLKSMNSKYSKYLNEFIKHNNVVLKYKKIFKDINIVIETSNTKISWNGQQLNAMNIKSINYNFEY